MDICVYTLDELESHLRKTYSDPEKLIPLSGLRLNSYLNNPRAKKKDPVLYEYRIKDKLVAYRTLLPDLFFDRLGKAQRFAWLSGNWVAPEFRRQGWSTKLLKQAEISWEGRLMYTNYAPASKAVYDRTGQFPLLTKRAGRRFYLRAATEDLLGDRLGGREVLRLGDKTLNLLRERNLRKFQPVDARQCKVERLADLDPELEHLIANRQDHSLFRRTPEVFQWILRQPWLTEEKNTPLNYSFSCQAERFENILLKFTLPGHECGLLWLLIHNRALTAPYVFAESKRIYPFMARTLIHQMIEENCAYTTVRHPLLSEQLMTHKNRFLALRHMPQQLFAHQSILKEVPENLEIQDGDGDVVFTG